MSNMADTNKSKTGKICMIVLHTSCVLGVTSTPFMLESAFKNSIYIFDASNVAWKLAFLSLALTSLVLYFFAAFKDPGFIPLPEHYASENSDEEDGDANENLDMLEKGVKLRHCGFCGIKQPLRAKHCESCGRCVRRFDHHCPWLGNCVGEGNHRYFLVFLITSLVALVWSAVMVWNSYDSKIVQEETFTNHVRWIALAAIVILILPVCSLVAIHLYLAFCNLTTWEFVARHRISYLKNLEDFDANPFNLGVCRNGFVLFCSMSYQSWEKVYQKFMNRKHLRFDC